MPYGFFYGNPKPVHSLIPYQSNQLNIFLFSNFPLLMSKGIGVFSSPLLMSKGINLLLDTFLVFPRDLSKWKSTFASLGHLWLF